MKMKLIWQVLIVLLTLKIVKDSEDNFTKNESCEDKLLVINLAETVNINSELGKLNLKHLIKVLKRLNVKSYFTICEGMNKLLKENYVDIQISYKNGPINNIHKFDNWDSNYRI